MLKKLFKMLGGLVALVLVVGGVYVGGTVYRYNASMAKVYEIPVPDLSASPDPEIIARGKHVAESTGGCAGGDCHGGNLAGGETIEAGPVGKFSGPNITPLGVAASYSDGEIARVILHGVKRDGRSLRFMPAHEINWLPDEDLVAIISYLRSVPGVEKANGTTEIGLLGKLLDRHDLFIADVARRIDHEHRETAPKPAPDALYGAFLSRSCIGCHGEHLSGGKIPGAPPEMAIPANITPHASGIAAWSFSDFEHLLATGKRPDGREVNAMMPVQMLNNMNDTEKRALWAYLRSVPPREFGGR